MTRVLIRRTAGCLEVKESQKSRTSDHPSFGHRVNGEIGQWRRVMSEIFKMPSVQYLWTIQGTRSSRQLDVQTGPLGRGEHMNECETAPFCC